MCYARDSRKTDSKFLNCFECAQFGTPMLHGSRESQKILLSKGVPCLSNPRSKHLQSCRVLKDCRTVWEGPHKLIQSNHRIVLGGKVLERSGNFEKLHT